MNRKASLLKRLCTLIFAAVMLFTTCGCETEEEEIKYDAVTGYGLHIESDGTVTLNGEVFYGYGTNWHAGFDMSSSEEKVEPFFKALSEGGIPFIRVMMGVFYDTNVSFYTESTEKYFERMDTFVKMAEKYQIGVVASLMWNESTFFTYCGETLEDLGNPYSKGMALAKKYVTDVVTRYKDSPAIWAWEIGNEGNLSVDLDEDQGTVHSTYQLSAYYETISDLIYSIDSYRMITGGDGCPREHSYALRNGDSWSYKDDLDMVTDTLTYLNPGHIRCASMHVYGSGDQERFSTLLQACKNLNLCCFVGEFGVDKDTLADNFGDAKTAEEMPEEAAEQESWNSIVDTLLESDIQIACQWCLGRNINLRDLYSIELGFVKGLYQNVYQWDRLVEINKNFVETGKNKSASYWENAQNLLYKE